MRPWGLSPWPFVLNDSGKENFDGKTDGLGRDRQEGGLQGDLRFGASGHGCGHNMLGTASLSAAITWHPEDLARSDTGSSLANYQVAYKFYGTSAHAGGAPHLGRSALDALELMNMGVQFLREHVIPEARIHYAITNTGGYSPNVVQPYAEVLYLIRAPKNRQVKEIYRRVNKIAEGAAHMTETRVEIDFVKGCSNLISNKVVAKKLWENLMELGAPEYTEEEMALATAISEGVGDSWFESLEKIAKACGKEEKKAVLAQGKSGLAHKGLIYAAKAMAGAAIDMYEDPEVIAEAKAEMEETLEGDTYQCPIPDGCRPRAIGMTK